jgi:glycerol uptake facilitator-like aquaporin
MEMDTKNMTAEAIGSLALTLLVFGVVAAEDADATISTLSLGLVLAILWMTFSGAQILPVITIGSMAAGKTDWQTGALNFCMQIVGALIGAAVMKFGQDAEVGTAYLLESFGVTEAATALVGGFLLMTVYDRLGGGWATGLFAMVVAGAGVSISGASDLAATLVNGNMDADGIFLAMFGAMIVGGVGAAAALMVGDQFLPEEE